MEKTQAIHLVGLNDKGGPIFDVDVTVLDYRVADRSCSEAQLIAVRKFYCYGFPREDLTDSQAHSLLSYREYARDFAAYISSNPRIAAYAIIRSNRRFHTGAGKAYVARTKYFGEIVFLCKQITLELQQHGIAL